MFRLTHRAGFIQNIEVDRIRGCQYGGEACACPTGKVYKWKRCWFMNEPIITIIDWINIIINEQNIIKEQDRNYRHIFISWKMHILNSDILSFKDFCAGAGEMSCGFRSPTVLLRRPRFNTQSQYGSSQLSITPILGDTTLFSGYCGPCKPHIIHKNKEILLKNGLNKKFSRETPLYWA